MFVTLPETFNLRKSVFCGQAFRWAMLNASIFWGATGSHAILMLPKGDNQFEVSCSMEDWEQVWIRYFALDRDWESELQALDLDDFARAATVYSKGIHILRQDPLEVIVSYLLSQRNHIPAISSGINRLCARYGEPIDLYGYHRNLFPTLERLSELTIEDFDSLKFGYRSPYVYSAIQWLYKNPGSLEWMKTLSYEELYETLTRFSGIGPKVANCICLFGFEHVEAFPVDVWMQRIQDRYYNGYINPKTYGDIAGLIQQYMFFYYRSTQGR